MAMGTRELVKKVQLYSGFSDQESQMALEQMVDSLARRLTEGERKDFASQLPPELQMIARDALPLADKHQDIVGEFMEAQRVPEPRAKKQILSSWHALKDAITPGEIEDMRANATVALLH
ncbi:MAG TPA: DUF2267 domain-containing protein [Candidatus Saccharimonadales bacterium]|nr:DUF2267 domain-containing protein [Candidatus Saccharimonadales bacterium]